jgi:hypothetical protein
VFISAIFGALEMMLWSQVQNDLNAVDTFAIPGRFEYGYSFYLNLFSWVLAAVVGVTYLRMSTNPVSKVSCLFVIL